MQDSSAKPAARAVASDAGAASGGPGRSLRAAWPEVERLYGELRTIAQSMMRGPSNARTLQVTALVHEAAVRMLNAEGRAIDSSKHFLAYAAVVMRRILIDHANRRRLRNEYAASFPEIDQDVDRLERSVESSLGALDAVLERLRGVDPRAAEMVDYRFFVGLSMGDTAEALGMSKRSAERKWQLTRAWLEKELRDDA